MLETCQPGFELREQNSLFTCRCTDSDFYILNCEEDVIVLRDGLWAGAELEPLPHLDLTVCPTPYCQCHTRADQLLCESLYYQNSSESRQQCHPTRNGEGPLCFSRSSQHAFCLCLNKFIQQRH